MILDPPTVGPWVLFRMVRSRWSYGCHLRKWVEPSVVREMAVWCADTFSGGYVRDLAGVLELSDCAVDWSVQGQTNEVLIESYADLHYAHFAKDHHRVTFLLRWSDI